MWTVGGGKKSFWVKENPQTDGEESPKSDEQRSEQDIL